MNSIILNGRSSRDVQGLLIQSLPPITKPMMRTVMEQIDGRDGDIVTKLGYGAYDKQFSAGLHGDYDVDEVIAFFDSEGMVIFSNEPDKYYDYQILSQIDFERLIRFRTAVISMHCQPFKHSAVERSLSFDIKSGTQSFAVSNTGNTAAKPKITVSGSGTVHLSLNGGQILAVHIGDENNITIDTARMEAYKDGILKNRLVVGDYDSISLKPGKNVFTWSGSLTGLSVENYSRWI